MNLQDKLLEATISEIEQYQNLYSRINKAFALDEMYTDVEEPLQKLDEQQKRVKENAEHRRENLMNIVLAVIAVLSIFSALKDSFDYLGDPLNIPHLTFFFGFLAFVGIVVIAAIIIYRWFNRDGKQ